MLSSDQLKLTKTYSDNVIQSITVRDLDGNEEDVIIEISNIDRITPDATIEYSETEKTKDNQYIKFNKIIVNYQKIKEF